jgi:hypothetical protein
MVDLGEMNVEAASYLCRLFNFPDQSHSPTFSRSRAWIDVLMSCILLWGDDV